MNNGISVYAGLNCSLEENLSLIEFANDLGFKRLFTSVNIPEADSNSDGFAVILATAIDKDFEIILDVTPETIATFDFALDFEQITPRLDDGFNPRQISALSHIRPIMINASTVNEELLIELTELNADFGNISALHNFYPQIYSALDTNYFKSQNNLFHHFGIEVGAFVASKDGRRRSPLMEGLPTLELTRNFSVDLSARYLSALNTDFIIISDSLPVSNELATIINLKSDEIVFQIELLNDNDYVKELLSNTFISRPEISSCIVRSTSRFNSQTILNDTPQTRQRGDITVNNANFNRYVGELHIVKTDLPSDVRVNKIAKIIDSDLLLLDCLTSNKKFSFKF